MLLLISWLMITAFMSVLELSDDRDGKYADLY